MKGIIIFFVLGILFYLLYVNGYLIISTKRAFTFVGTIRGKNGCKASFSSCSGYMKRIIRFKENKTFDFKLISELSKGEMLVEIWDSKKQPIISLGNNNQSGSINVNKNQRYYLVFKFKSATGSYIMTWN